MSRLGFALFAAFFLAISSQAYSSEDSNHGISLIVIDPGHGGFDSGAKGPTGLEEKDVALSLAKRLKELIEKKTKIKALLTRDADYFVPLEERTLFAKNNNADLFISIHANAARKNAADGFETYFLGLEASDDDARAVAMYENSVRNMSGKDLRESDDVRFILSDMLNTATLNESSILAETIQKGFSKVMSVENRGVKQAPFIVLYGATMPAVLTEIAFISNPAQEKRLRDPAFLNKIAESLYNSIIGYKTIYEEKTLPLAAAERSGKKDR